MKRYFGKMIVGYMILVVALVLPTKLFAQEKFPNETITLLFGWGTGGAGDLMVRGLAELMQKDLNVPVIVENKPGGGGVLSWSLLQAAKPEGYTVATVTPSVIMETYKTKGKIDYNKFEPIVRLNSAPNAIIVHMDSPYKTIGEFLEYAKANPGKVRIGNSGMGAGYHITAIALEKGAGVKFTHVPFKTTADCGPALLGKHIEAVATTPGDLSASLATGKLRILATTGEKRDPLFPDVPILKENGINVVMEQWRAMVAPKGIPSERIAVLEKAFIRAMQQPKYNDLLKKLMLENNYMGTAEIKKFYFSQAEFLLPILKSLDTEAK